MKRMKICSIGLVAAVLLVCLPTETFAGNGGFGISITIGGYPGFQLGYGYPGGYRYGGRGSPGYSRGGNYGRPSYYSSGPPPRSYYGGYGGYPGRSQYPYSGGYSSSRLSYPLGPPPRR